MYAQASPYTCSTYRPQTLYLLLLIGCCLLLSLLPVQAAETSDNNAQRIVSVNGSLTEIVYRLEAQDQLVGVDTTSQYPAAAMQLPQVGYQRQLSAEGILSLQPDVVLATSEAGPPTVLEQIQAAGVELVSVPVDYSTEGVLAKIQAVAATTGKQEAGEQLAQNVANEMSQLQAQLDPEAAKPGVVFLLSMGNGSPMAAGRDTAANAMIELAGGENVFASHYSGYKPVSAEAMIAAQPDILLMSQDALQGLGGVAGAVELPGVALTPAGKQQRIVTLDGLHLLGFSPRLPDALSTLHQQFYPIP